MLRRRIETSADESVLLTAYSSLGVRAFLPRGLQRGPRTAFDAPLSVFDVERVKATHRATPRAHAQRRGLSLREVSTWRACSACAAIPSARAAARGTTHANVVEAAKQPYALRDGVRFLAPAIAHAPRRPRSATPRARRPPRFRSRSRAATRTGLRRRARIWVGRRARTDGNRRGDRSHRAKILAPDPGGRRAADFIRCKRPAWWKRTCFEAQLRSRALTAVEDALRAHRRQASPLITCRCCCGSRATCWSELGRRDQGRAALPTIARAVPRHRTRSCSSFRPAFRSPGVATADAGQKAQARQLIAPLYAWFTEGFDNGRI